MLMCIRQKQQDITLPSKTATENISTENFETQHGLDEGVSLNEKKESVIKSISGFFSKSLDNEMPHHKEEKKQAGLPSSENESLLKQESKLTSFILLTNTPYTKLFFTTKYGNKSSLQNLQYKSC